MKRLLILLMISQLQLVHAQAIYKKEDSFSGNTHYYTLEKSVELEGGSFFSMRYVTISLHTYRNPPTLEKPFYIQLTANTPSWIFVSRGESLLLKINGEEPIKIADTGTLPLRQVLGASSVLEVVRYPITIPTLLQISEAKTVDFRVLGERQVLTGKFTPEFLKEAKYFLGQSSSLIEAPKKLAASPAPFRAPRRLGVSFLPITKELRALIKNSEIQGLIIVAIEPGSVAESAGLAIGDIIQAVNKTPTLSTIDLQEAIAKSDTNATLEIYKDGKSMQIDVNFKN